MSTGQVKNVRNNCETGRFTPCPGVSPELKVDFPEVSNVFHCLWFLPQNNSFRQPITGSLTNSSPTYNVYSTMSWISSCSYMSVRQRPQYFLETVWNVFTNYQWNKMSPLKTSQPQNTENRETDVKNQAISVKIWRLIDRQTKPSKHRF